MATRIVLLRAINVGGTARVPMAELREIAAGLGASGVRTHLASGNLVAEIDGDAAEFDRALEAGIEAHFGFFREVISRSPHQVSAALAAHPFEVVDAAHSAILFLDRPPAAETLDRAAGVRSGSDEWMLVGAEVHVRYSAGAGRAELSVPALLKALGVIGTGRNLTTVRALERLAADGQVDTAR